MRHTHDGYPVNKMRVVRELVNEVRRNAQNDNRRDPMQYMVGQDGWSVP
jgi:hypothetical protein